MGLDGPPRRWPSVTSLRVLGTVGAAAALWLIHVQTAAAQVTKSVAVPRPRPAVVRALTPVLAKLPQPAPTAYLRVAAHQPKLIFKTTGAPPERFTRDAFDIYKNTQAELLKSPFVLIAALRGPEIAKLQCVKRRATPVRWLQDELEVNFPGDAEIMRVSLVGDEPKESALLLNAIVDAYLREVVDMERKRRNDRLNELDDVYSAKYEQVRRKMNEFRKLAEALGTGSPEAMKLKQQIALRRFGDVQTACFRTRLARSRAEGELKVRRTLLNHIDNLEISQVEVDIFSQSDPAAADLFQQTFALKKKLADIEGSEAAAASVERLKGRLKAVQEELNARQTQLRQLMRQKRRADIEVEIRRGEVELEVLADQEQELAKDVGAREQEVERLSTSSIDLEMMRGEIDRLNVVLATVHGERERIRVELRSAPRITLIQRAEHLQ